MQRRSGIIPAILLVALTTSAMPLGAQVVRGVVRDSATGVPLPGVIVALDEAVAQLDTEASLRRASLVLAVLTDERGEFAVRAGFAGRFVLSAKRVGMRRFVSPSFTLASGEQRRMDVTLSGIDFAATLPRVTTLTDAPCSVRPEEGERVAAVWEEARAALTASRLALRDRLFRATITRYVRDLRPVSFRVIREDRGVRHGVTERAFASLAAEQLSAQGYVHAEAEGAWTFHAPDATVLTSTEFLRDHCFSIVSDRRRHAGEIGLAFDPVRGRRTSDVSGALWLDSMTAELRLVEFRYVNLDESLRRDDARGEVHFARTKSGSWYVQRWFIRMPQYGRTARANASIQRDATAPELMYYREEGGDVRVTDGVSIASMASLRGLLMDSTGRAPLRNATVRLAGTQFSAKARSDGLFRLDSLPLGAYTLVVEHPQYAALGMHANEQELELTEASESMTAVQALGTEAILRRLCARSAFEEDQAVLRVLVESDTGVPAPGVEVRARWDVFERRALNELGRFPIIEKIASDDHGAATFCNVPARTPVVVEIDAPDGAPLRRDVTLAANTIVVEKLSRQ